MYKSDYSDYGYLNARVRAMRSFLLDRESLVRLANSGDKGELNPLLDQTIYRREVSEAILENPARPDYYRALDTNMVSMFRKIHGAAGGEARDLINILLSEYELHNLKTVLRGVKSGVPPSSMVRHLMLVGSIKSSLLEQLANQGGLRDAIRLMVSKQLPYAAPIVAAYEKYMKSGQDFAVLENALDRFYFTSVLDELERFKEVENARLVREIIELRIDIVNLLTLMRIRALTVGDIEAEALRIPGGRLSAKQFLGLRHAGDVQNIVAAYPDRSFEGPLKRAMSDYLKYDLVSFSRELERELVRRSALMACVDALGIGVVIAFIYSKQNEVVNLRLIIQGIQAEQAPEEILRGLFIPGHEAEVGMRASG